MASLKAQYGSLTTLAMTSLNSLPNGSAASSVYVDNTVTLFDDIFLNIKIAASSGSYCLLGVYTSLDGIDFSGSELGIDGTDHVLSDTNYSDYDNLTNQRNNYMNNIGTGGVSTFSCALSTLFANFYSITGPQIIPPYWGLVLVNKDGADLGASGNVVKYRGYYAQIA